LQQRRRAAETRLHQHRAVDGALGQQIFQARDEDLGEPIQPRHAERDLPHEIGSPPAPIVGRAPLAPREHAVEPR
jgi:hypothetical protein